MFWIDPTYFWYVFIPTLLLSLGVQLYLRSTFNKWANVRNGNNINGLQVGQALFQRTSLKPIPLQRISGTLNDHFDPRANVVRLSDQSPPANGGGDGRLRPRTRPRAAVSNRLGLDWHAQFSAAGAQFSPTISYIAIFLGLWFNMVNLMWIGIFFCLDGAVFPS
jgi:Zn-dependent membrane protease YugP